MNAEQDRDGNVRKASVRLYQVNLPVASSPILVAASGVERALTLALGGKSRSGLPGKAMIWDATEEWGALSLKVLGHTALLLDSGMEEVVTYDEEVGWRAVRPAPHM